MNESIKLYKGNNTEVLSELNLDMSKCIFVSDPPFNIGYHYNTYKDNMDEDEYYKWLFSIFGNNKQVIIHYPEKLYQYSSIIKMFPEKVVSWVYNSMNPRQHRDIAFFGIRPDFSKVGQPYKNPNDKRIAKRIKEGKKARLYDWWNINQVKNVNKEKTKHPAQMPVEVMDNIIGILPNNYTIIDPFMGSGSTALACLNNNRKFIGIEIDEEYYHIAYKRLKEHHFYMQNRII